MYDNFPYSNFHDLNTDWIVKKIKDVETSEANAKASEENAKTSEENAKQYEESAEALAEQASTHAINAREYAQAAAQSATEAAETVADTAEQVTLLQSRVDNIIPSGTQTEGNTELLDIRVAEDGQIYDSAGNAVRGQISNLKHALNAKFGFSKIENTTLINRESIGEYNQSPLSNTRRWFIPQIFNKNTYINKINFKCSVSTQARVINFEVWSKSNDTLTKVKTVSVNTQEPTVQQIAKIYTANIDYQAENDCMIAIISTFSSVIYANLNQTENTMLSSSNTDIDATELSYSTLGVWYMDLSATIYCMVYTSINVITIGEGMDYEEIQPALLAISDDSPTNPYTLLLMPKKTPYQPFTMLRNSFSKSYPWSNIKPRNISIIGLDKYNCVIQSNSGDYKYPCSEIMTNGIIKNLKFIMTNDDQTETATQGGYCMHIDCRTLNDEGYNMIIEDCDFEDSSGPCLGIGMHKNCTLTIRRCTFETNLSANYNPHEGYRNLVNYGVIFCHTSTLADSTAQNITFEDCTGVCVEGNKSLQIASAGSYDQSTSEFTYTLLRNIFWNKAVNDSAYSISNNLTANPMNFGNNN